MARLFQETRGRRNRDGKKTPPVAGDVHTHSGHISTWPPSMLWGPGGTGLLRSGSPYNSYPVTCAGKEKASLPEEGKYTSWRLHTFTFLALSRGRRGEHKETEI